MQAQSQQVAQTQAEVQAAARTRQDIEQEMSALLGASKMSAEETEVLRETVFDLEQRIAGPIAGAIRQREDELAAAKKLLAAKDEQHANLAQRLELTQQEDKLTDARKQMQARLAPFTPHAGHDIAVILTPALLLCPWGTAESEGVS